MPETVILRDKPSIVPIIVVWPLTGVVFACPLLALAMTMGKSISILGAMFVGLAVLVLMLAVLRLVFDLVSREFTTYILTDTHVIKEFGILTRRRRAMPVDRSGADVVTPLAGRFFNYATLRVHCTGLGSVALYYLPNPERWLEEINKRNALRVAITPTVVASSKP